MGTSGSCKVGIGLELPVSPADEMLISNIAHLVDLLSAGAFCEASSKLSDDKRDTEAIGVLSSLANSLLVPFEALGLMSDRRLTSEALFGRQLAAVGVIVEDLPVGIVFSTW